MSWNDNNDGRGGWKSGGGGGPWGQGPNNGSGNQPHDLEEMLKRSQDRMKNAMHGGGIPGPLMFLALLAALAVAGFFLFTFTVKPDELGVVLRFGKTDRIETSGLHLRLPYPIEEVLLPKVTRENSVEVGLRTLMSSSGTSSSARDVPEESLMLTGDENIVDVDFNVFWRIKADQSDEETGQSGAEQFLFNIQNPVRTIKEVAESTMREVVGQSNIEQIITEKRQEVQNKVQTLMQQTLDSYHSGIRITRVQMLQGDPPSKVIDAFRDVQAAEADQERIQNEAQAYANKVVPEARGEAQRILQAADAYKQRVVQEAKGQAARFEKVLDEYKKAPEVTRKRIFLETMERVFSGTDKIILDSKQGGSGVVPYLPLNELRPRTPAASAGGQ